ncbi:MAG TPA: hypothetical protein VD996_02645 [Chitinophagaceae bacterium]|nr:hypothetical protein [Chitinophagaceae bacterium]
MILNCACQCNESHLWVLWIVGSMMIAWVYLFVRPNKDVQERERMLEQEQNTTYL